MESPVNTENGRARTQTVFARRCSVARSSLGVLALLGASQGCAPTIPTDAWPGVSVATTHTGSTDSDDVDENDTEDSSVDTAETGDTALPPAPMVRINEAMSDNRTVIEGPGGVPTDWLELVNLDSSTVDLSGWALSNDWREPDAAPLPAGIVLAPGERVLLWLDGEGGAATTVSLRLSRDGESIWLFDPNGQEADQLALPALDPNQAWARIPDGTGAFEAMPLGTPGAPNQRLAESILTVVDAGTEWLYLDGGAVPSGGADGSWTTASFNTRGWSTGQAPLGYGDAQSTVIDEGLTDAGRALTAWFRRSFTITADSVPTSATLGLRADDGARVFLDGVELLRLGLPAGTIDENTAANRTVSGDAEFSYTEFSVDPSLLAPGEHVFAVDVHQAGPTSSDLTFDLWLTGEWIVVAP